MGVVLSMKMESGSVAVIEAPVRYRDGRLERTTAARPGKVPPSADRVATVCGQRRSCYCLLKQQLIREVIADMPRAKVCEPILSGA